MRHRTPTLNCNDAEGLTCQTMMFVVEEQGTCVGLWLWGCVGSKCEHVLLSYSKILRVLSYATAHDNSKQSLIFPIIRQNKQFYMYAIVINTLLAKLSCSNINNHCQNTGEVSDVTSVSHPTLPDFAHPPTSLVTSIILVLSLVLIPSPSSSAILYDPDTDNLLMACVVHCVDSTLFFRLTIRVYAFQPWYITAAALMA